MLLDFVACYFAVEFSIADFFVIAAEALIWLKVKSARVSSSSQLAPLALASSLSFETGVTGAPPRCGGQTGASLV